MSRLPLFFTSTFMRKALPLFALCVLLLTITPVFASPLFVDEADACEYFYDFESYEDCVFSDDGNWANWEEYDYPNIIFLNYTIPEDASIVSWDVSLTFGEEEVEIFNITDSITSSCPSGDGNGILMLHWNSTGSCYADGIWNVIFDNASTFIEGGVLFDIADDETEIQSVLTDVGEGLGAFLSAVTMPLGNMLMLLGVVGALLSIFMFVLYIIKGGLER